MDKIQCNTIMNTNYKKLKICNTNEALEKHDIDS